MKLKNLPTGLKELLQVAMGFYLVIAATAIFCDWNTPYRLAVLFVLFIGFILVGLLELVAAYALLGLLRVFGTKAEKDKVS